MAACTGEPTTSESAAGSTVATSTSTAPTTSAPTSTVAGDGTTSAPSGLPGTIIAGDGPCDLALAGGRVWVSLLGDEVVVPIDPESGVVGDPVAVPGSPCWMAGDGDSLWVAPSAAGHIEHLDAATGRRIGRIELADGPVDAQLTFAFGDLWATVPPTDEVVRIAPDGEIVARIPVVDDPGGTVEGDGLLWVASAASGRVAAVDPATNAVARTFDVPGADRVIAHADGSLWVGSAADRTLTAVDPGSGAVVAVYPVGGNPQPGAVAAGRIWVPNHEDDTLSVVELAGGAGGRPRWAPTRRRCCRWRATCGRPTTATGR